jgi:hypothetical protein
LVDARDSDVHLGCIYIMIKNEGIFVHPERINQA